MSKSLKIEGGDLKVGTGRSFETVVGAEKLAQDLELWVLERIGIDPATPTYGSSLDGGIVNGVSVASFIGQVMTAERVNEARAQVLNILTQYQQGQLNKMKRELVEYGGKHTLDADEVLQSIDSIQAAASGTTVIIRATFTTLAQNTFNLTVPVA